MTPSSDEEGQKMTDTAQPITRPPGNLQTIFADNIVNLARGSGVVKFYLTRFDPPMSGNAQPDSVPVCQVIMPIRTFAAMTVFFQQQLEIMIQNKEVTREFVDQMKVLVAKPGQSNAS
jgi:hypothetical protein